MAKKSKVVNNHHKIKLSNRYYEKRKKLLEQIYNPELSFEERQAFRLKLEKLPKKIQVEFEFVIDVMLRVDPEEYIENLAYPE